MDSTDKQFSHAAGLAWTGVLRQVEVVDVDLILSAALDDPDPRRRAWLRNSGYDLLCEAL